MAQVQAQTTKKKHGKVKATTTAATTSVQAAHKNKTTNKLKQNYNKKGTVKKRGK